MLKNEIYVFPEQKPVFNTYLKSKLTGVLMTSNFDPEVTAEVKNDANNIPGAEETKAEDDDDDLIIIDEPEVNIAINVLRTPPLHQSQTMNIQAYHYPCYNPSNFYNKKLTS